MLVRSKQSWQKHVFNWKEAFEVTQCLVTDGIVGINFHMSQWLAINYYK